MARSAAAYPRGFDAREWPLSLSYANSTGQLVPTRANGFHAAAPSDLLSAITSGVRPRAGGPETRGPEIRPTVERRGGNRAIGEEKGAKWSSFIGLWGKVE